MSGHSKWSKIQHKKGKTDKARSSLFTKLLRGITVSAGQGGGDPDMNFSLRLAIDRAKAGNVPKDNIERAIKKGVGEGKNGVAFEEILYEGFGPSGVAVLVETLTDNKNRTVSEIKHTLSKHGGSLGTPGSVQWQFDRMGVVRVDRKQLEANSIARDDFDLQMMDVGVDDIIDEDGSIEFHSSVDVFKTVLDKVISFGIEPEDSELEWIAKETIEVDEDVSKKIEALYEVLEEDDDVKDVYMNI